MYCLCLVVSQERSRACAATMATRLSCADCPLQFATLSVSTVHIADCPLQFATFSVSTVRGLFACTATKGTSSPVCPAHTNILRSLTTCNCKLICQYHKRVVCTHRKHMTSQSNMSRSCSQGTYTSAPQRHKYTPEDSSEEASLHHQQQQQGQHRLHG